MHNISIPGRDGFQGRLGRKGKPYGKRDGIAVCSPCNSNGFNFVDPSGDSWKAGPDALGIETKLNLFGNDTFQKPGSTALAILTAIDIPTVRNGVGEKDVEGSVALPFAIKLTEKSRADDQICTSTAGPSLLRAYRTFGVRCYRNCYRTR